MDDLKRYLGSGLIKGNSSQLAFSTRTINWIPRLPDILAAFHTTIPVRSWGEVTKIISSRGSDYITVKGGIEGPGWQIDDKHIQVAPGDIAPELFDCPADERPPLDHRLIVVRKK